MSGGVTSMWNPPFRTPAVASARLNRVLLSCSDLASAKSRAYACMRPVRRRNGAVRRESLRQISLSSGRHARSEHGIRHGRASNLCSPLRRWFFGKTDQRSGKRLLTTSVETDLLIRPFTRQRRRLPCGFLRSRVVAPGLYLRDHPGSSASPYRFRAPGLVLAF